MITFRLFAQPMLQQRTDYFCEKCMRWGAYYIKKAPSKCGGCQRKLPDLEGLLLNKFRRKDYHFSK